jgi:hypothetical protein
MRSLAVEMQHTPGDEVSPIGVEPVYANAQQRVNAKEKRPCNLTSHQFRFSIVGVPSCPESFASTRRSFHEKRLALTSNPSLA